MLSISFRTPTTVSVKNSRRIVRGRGGRPRSIKTERQRACLARVREDCLAAMRAAGVPGVGEGPDGALTIDAALWGRDSVEMHIVHDVDADELLVTVTWSGSDPVPPRRGEGYRKTGRARDLQNLQEAVCDALQGILYDDDRQIDALHMRRHRGVV